MIKSVRLVNFFSFGDCTIDLESDLNVLVGINGSGKSNFLRAFQLLKAGLDGRLREQIVQWGGMNAIYQKNAAKSHIMRDISLFFTVANTMLDGWADGYKGDVTYHISFLGQGKNEFLIDEKVWRPDGNKYFDSFDGNAFLSPEAIVGEAAAGRHKLGNGKELILPTLFGSGASGGLINLYYNLHKVDTYRLFNTVEDAPMRTTVRATGVDKLLPNGDNMFQVLNVTGLKSTAAYDA
ncbi:MAG: hypothetical protein EOO61_19755, partial [Hymenobacter sp.]